MVSPFVCLSISLSVRSFSQKYLIRFFWFFTLWKGSIIRKNLGSCIFRKILIFHIWAERAQNAPKTGFFFEETHQFYCNCPRMKDNIAGRLLSKTPYQVKFMFLSYSPNFSLPIRLQDFLNFKACVCYFLWNFCFSPNDSPWKTMKNVFYFI